MVTLGHHDWYWSTDLVCSHAEFLKGLSCFVSKTRQVVLEGASKEVAELLAPISQKPLFEVESGYFHLFRKPKFIGIQLVPGNLGTLLQVTEKHPGLEVFAHCHVIDSSGIWMEAHDACGGEVRLSPLLPIGQINEYGSFMKVKFERQEIS